MKNKVKLGDLVNIKTGKLDANAAVANGKYPFFTTSEETFKIDTYAYDDEAVLVAGNGNLNVKYFHGKFNAYQRTYILTKKENINVNIKYIYYFLDKYLGTLRSLSIGGVIKYIKLENLINPILKLPTIEFQNKIVKKLDTLKEILDISRKKLNMLSDFNKSLFTTMFGDIKTNDKNWEIKKLGEVIQTQYGTSKKATSIVTGFPILRMNNITYSGEMDYRDLKYIELSDNEKEKFLLKKGELLFNRTNSKELVGKTGLFELDTPMAFAGYLIKMKPSNLIHSKFLLFFMNSEFMKKLLYNKAKNIVGMANINAKELEDFSIILPPIELQNKFAERIEKIEKLKFEIEKSIEVAQNLYDSLISKYFDN